MRTVQSIPGLGAETNALAVRERLEQIVTGRRSWLAPLILALIAVALLVPRLGQPDVFVFDELYYVHTAGKYVEGDSNSYRWTKPPRDRPAIEWTHPPMAKLLIAGGILVFGDNPIGWRAVSVIFGIAGVLVTFALGRALTGGWAIGVGAAGLLLLDGLYFVESRTGMPNLMLLVYAAAALLAFWYVLNADPRRVGVPLALTGALLGFALATKWSGVALAGLIGLAFLWHGWREHRGAPSRMLGHLWRGFLALIVLPVVIYGLSYGHFFATGHDWADFVALHQAMFSYHRGLGVVHAYSSSWWEWPLVARPVWYFAAREESSGSFVFANGNPLLYWPMVVAVGWVAIDWWGRRSTALVILAIGFFGQWLPWAFSPRGTFIYHFLPAVPFGCIALAVLLNDGWRRGSWQRGAAIIYVAAVIAMFFSFYPLNAAWPLTPEQVSARMLFPSWR